MKKFLGSLLTSLFIGSTTTSVISCNTDGKNKDVKPIKKQEITKNNLDEFFKVHNTFEYKGEFFFKDINDQSDEDNKRIINASEIFNYILVKSFANNFNEYFDYINNDYSFEFERTTRIREGFELNKNYIINFNVRINNKRGNDLKYPPKQLTLNFLETNQYSDQQWIDKYLEFLIEYGNSIWGDKYENYVGRFPYEPVADYGSKEEYCLNDKKNVLDNISKNYTDIFSSFDSSKFSIWFYKDKRMNVKAVEYTYLGMAPIEYAPDGGVRAKVHLIFEYVDNSDTKSEADVEIWMKFNKTN